MKCPIDGETLVIADRQGVEIDYCPQCRGVWLDRGELDKIVNSAGAAPIPSRGPDRRTDDKRRNKRDSFLGDLFDF